MESLTGYLVYFDLNVTVAYLEQKQCETLAWLEDVIRTFGVSSVVGENSGVRFSPFK